MPSKSAQRRWYQEKKRELNDVQNLRRRMFRGIIRELKSAPCTDCKVQYPYYVMQFDHLPGFVKKFDVSNLAAFSSVVTLLEEIDKCEIVCANCHAARTFIRHEGDGNLLARDARETQFNSGVLDVGEGPG
jgi:hypothetical protein